MTTGTRVASTLVGLVVVKLKRVLFCCGGCCRSEAFWLFVVR